MNNHLKNVWWKFKEDTINDKWRKSWQVNKFWVSPTVQLFLSFNFGSIKKDQLEKKREKNQKKNISAEMTGVHTWQLWWLLDWWIYKWLRGQSEPCDGQVWIWTERACKMIQRGTDKRDENERSFVIYCVCPLLWASRWQGGRASTTNTVEVRIRDLLNGGVWIIMNKGKIMIIINRLEGGGRVNENAFHSRL